MLSLATTVRRVVETLMLRRGPVDVVCPEVVVGPSLVDVVHEPCEDGVAVDRQGALPLLQLRWQHREACKHRGGRPPVHGRARSTVSTVRSEHSEEWGE